MWRPPPSVWSCYSKKPSLDFHEIGCGILPRNFLLGHFALHLPMFIRRSLQINKIHLMWRPPPSVWSCYSKNRLWIFMKLAGEFFQKIGVQMWVLCISATWQSRVTEERVPDCMADLHVTPMTTCWFYENRRADSITSLTGVNGFLCCVARVLSDRATVRIRDQLVMLFSICGSTTRRSFLISLHAVISTPVPCNRITPTRKKRAL